MYYPDFVAAKRAEVPDYVGAAWAQGDLDRQAYEAKMAQREKTLRAPIDLYEGYVNLTEHNPLADAVRKFRGGNAPAAAMPRATDAVTAGPMSVPPSSGLAASGTTVPQGTALPQAGASALPQGGSQLAGPMSQAPQQTASKFAPFAKMGGPIIGGLAGAGISAATGGSTEDIVRQGAGGAASGALMSFAPAMAAAGPPGWAGMAGLAALSLYGLLG